MDRKRLAPLAGVLAVAGIGVVMIMALQALIGEAPLPHTKKVQQISIIKPPPPPPPPKIEKPPEPEIEEVEVPEPEEVVEEVPEADSDEPPPGTDLGLDAEGGAGGDAFGLRGKKGARSLIGGSSGSRFGWYAGILQREIQAHLSVQEGVRQSQYTVVARLWIDSSGRIERAQLVGSTGDVSLDRRLESALSGGGFKVSEAPPDDMPQPVRLRIRSRI